MKKTHILLSGIALAMSINANAQIYTGTDATLTGNVGIGTSTVPTDARLHIYNNQYYLAHNVPEIMIDRNIGPFASTTNFFQITDHTTLISTLSNVLDVINPNGWLGILRPIPGAALDVNGNGIIEQSLTVDQNANIGNNLTVTNTGTIGTLAVNHSGSIGTTLSVGTNLTVSQNATIGNDLYVQGGLIDMSKTIDTWRTLQANSLAAGLSLYSKTANTNGSAIELFGPTNTTSVSTGSIHYTSYGKADFGHIFQYYNASTNTLHTSACIGSNGTIIGEDTHLSDITNGDALTVESLMGFYKPASSNDWRGIDGNSWTGGLAIVSQSSTYNGSSISLYGGGSTFPDATRAGQIQYASYGNAGGWGHLFYNLPAGSTSFEVLMAIGNSGKVVIGKDLIWGTPSSTPGNYLLYVEQGILTEKLKVANHTDGANWSDFVFKSDYKLMSLNEVEQYVNINKHLPEIPSASEVAKDGIDVEDMDAKLLQKIEELTLYVIQQQKEIDELKKQIKN